MKDFFSDLKDFFLEFFEFVVSQVNFSFFYLEKRKGKFAASLYRQRGKLSRKLIHMGMAGLTAFGMVISPIITDGLSQKDSQTQPGGVVLSAYASDTYLTTEVSDKLRDKIIEYVVQDGDTVSSIAKKFDVTEDTIRWQNNLKSKSAIKVGQTLGILPVTGVSHKVTKGDTVYSIAKKYDTSPQSIVDFPFNTFTNDETFALAIGQIVTVPDGVKQEAELWSPSTRVRQITPDAGTVVASGSFVWPAAGTISQRYVWYHGGIDIANKASPTIVAADAGKVIMAGWPDNVGYGNRVIIDHGNGYVTLYAHLSQVFVIPGQSVTRGAAIGKMGSTGRSTGIHLHFEVIKGGSKLNPLDILR